jgi:hypothetical protein
VINAWPLDYLIRFTQKTKPAEMSHQKHSFRARADFGWTTFKSPISWAFFARLKRAAPNPVLHPQCAARLPASLFLVSRLI